VFTGHVWMPATADGMDDEVGTEVADEYKCFRITVIKDTMSVLEFSPYDLPVPEWFAPCPNEDTSLFWPRNSIATRLLELQAIVNDNYTVQILGGISVAKRTVYASGVADQDMKTAVPGFGAVVTTRSPAKFWSAPGQFSGGGDLMLQAQELQKMADGQGRVSEVGAGQYSAGDKTATETSAVLAGQMAGVRDYKLTMVRPFEEAVQLLQILLQRHWKTVKKVHGDLLRTDSASEWGKKFTIQANGRAPANDPNALLAKVGQVIQLAQGLQVQLVPGGQYVEAGKLFEQALAALDLPFDTEGIVVNPNEQSLDGDQNGAGGAEDALFEAARLLGDQFEPAAPEGMAGLAQEHALPAYGGTGAPVPGGNGAY